MKTDLASSVGVAILGVIIAYFVCNMLIPAIEDYTVKTVGSSVNAEIIEPSPEVFNYKAINPTVEVYVGDCTELDDRGECIDQPAGTSSKESTNQGNS